MTGLEVLRHYASIKNSFKFIILSNFQEDAYNSRRNKARCKSLCLKDIVAGNIVEVINTLLKEKIYYSQQIMSAIVNQIQMIAPLLPTKRQV